MNNELEIFFEAKPRKDMSLNNADACRVSTDTSKYLYEIDSKYTYTECTYKDIQDIYKKKTITPGSNAEHDTYQKHLIKIEECVDGPKEATKYDADKVDYSLLSDDALQEISKVFMFGAKKYARWNYTEGNGMDWLRLWRSLARHIFAWKRGQDNDPESGLSHLAHAGCCIIMLLHYVKNKKIYNKDDRYKY